MSFTAVRVLMGNFLMAPEEERWLDSVSVADVYIDIDGSHVVAFNDLRPGPVEQDGRDAPEIFWQQGLVGFGGLGLMIESPGKSEPERFYQSQPRNAARSGRSRYSTKP